MEKEDRILKHSRNTDTKEVGLFSSPLIALENDASWSKVFDSARGD